MVIINTQKFTSLESIPFPPPPSTLAFIGPKFGWLHGNQCLGRIQGACRVALVVVVSITELLQRWFSTMGQALLWPTTATLVVLIC